mgnify:CR=1 FL=1
MELNKLMKEVRQALEERIEREGLQDHFGKIIVPTEEVEKNETLEVAIFICYLLGLLILFKVLITPFGTKMLLSQNSSKSVR